MPALSHQFRTPYVGRCWACGGEISLGDMVAFDQDSQVVHDYCV